MTQTRPTLCRTHQLFAQHLKEKNQVDIAEKLWHQDNSIFCKIHPHLAWVNAETASLFLQIPPQTSKCFLGINTSHVLKGSLQKRGKNTSKKHTQQYPQYDHTVFSYASKEQLKKHPFQMLKHAISNSGPLPLFISSSTAAFNWGALGLLGIHASIDEVYSALKGDGFSFEIPPVLGVCLKGTPLPFLSGPEIALFILEWLQKKQRVFKAIEFFGPSIQDIPFSTRVEVNRFMPYMEASHMLWPADMRTCEHLESFFLSKECVASFQQCLQKHNLFYTSTENEPLQHTLYNDVLEINLSQITSGKKIKSVFREEDLQSIPTLSQNVRIAYTPTSGGTLLKDTPCVSFHIAPMGFLHESHDFIRCIHIAKKAVQKKISLKAKGTFSLPQGDPLADLFAKKFKPAFEKLGLQKVSHLDSSKGSTTSSNTGDTYLASSPFALASGLAGIIHKGGIPDIDATLTLKDLWPNEKEGNALLQLFEEGFQSTFNLPQPEYQRASQKDTKMQFDTPWPPISLPKSSVLKAAFIPVLRDHDVGTHLFALNEETLLSELAQNTKTQGAFKNTNLPFSFYFQNPHTLRKVIEKSLLKYVPAYSEHLASLFAQNIPFVLIGSANYGRGVESVWLASALRFLNVRAVIAKSFTPLVHRSLLHCNILPLHWCAPMSYRNLALKGTEKLSIENLSFDVEKPFTTALEITTSDTSCQMLPLAFLPRGCWC